ncbi:MAG: cation:proton antiporter [Holophagae bacterium]|nr:cation:proton antiporter [Holophagae bacterium]
MNWKSIGSLLANIIAVSVLFSLILAGSSNIPHNSAIGPYLALGFLIIVAYLFGILGKELGFPALTGNLLAGILFGPSVLGFISHTDIQSLEFINTIALSFIALSAGGELKLKSLRKNGRAISGIILTHTILILGGTMVVMIPFLHFSGIKGLVGIQMAWMAGIVLAIVAVANSPSSTIAVINEYRAKGPFTDVVLSVTMVKDVVILLLFAVTMGIIRSIGGTESFSPAFLLHTFGDILLSIGAGLVYGGLMILFYRFVAREITVFIVIAAFLANELAHFAGLEQMLMCMIAGFVVQNFSRQGPLLIEGIEKSHLPIYVIFFSIAGAALDFSYFGSVYILVTLFVILRAGLVFSSTLLGAKLSGASPTIRKFAWTGFLTNAGLTLSIAIIVEQSFPDWGRPLKAIIISIIAINQIVGPVLFKIGLVKSGEVGPQNGRDG